jgi:hypothetical protein
MAPLGVIVRKPSPGRFYVRPRPDRFSLSDLPSLESKSDHPDVQRFLRDAIRRGMIRVQPDPGAPGRVKITRVVPGEGDVIPVRPL